MELKEGNKIPCIFYLYVHSKIREHSTGNIIRIKEATDYLHEWRIPKEIRIAIIKEMEILGLLEKIDRNSFRVKRQKIDLENINEIYSMVGIL